MDFRVFEAPAGERLDVAISLELETSRTYAKELVNEGLRPTQWATRRQACHQTLRAQNLSP